MTGASAAGLQGFIKLAAITFDCEARGDTDLSLAVSVFADATIADPTPIDPIVFSGEIQCRTGDPGPDYTPTPVVVDLGDTGTGFESSGNSRRLAHWAIAILLVAGVTGVVGGIFQARARRV